VFSLLRYMHPGPPERWWEWLLGTAGPVQTWLETLPEADRQKVLGEIYEALRAYYDCESVNVPITVIVASGSR
jgi:hypothetical protein